MPANCSCIVGSSRDDTFSASLTSILKSRKLPFACHMVPRRHGLKGEFLSFLLLVVVAKMATESYSSSFVAEPVTRPNPSASGAHSMASTEVPRLKPERMVTPSAPVGSLHSRGRDPFAPSCYPSYHLPSADRNHDLEPGHFGQRRYLYRPLPSRTAPMSYGYEHGTSHPAYVDDRVSLSTLPSQSSLAATDTMEYYDIDLTQDPFLLPPNISHEYRCIKADEVEKKHSIITPCHQ